LLFQNKETIIKTDSKITICWDGGMVSDFESRLHTRKPGESLLPKGNRFPLSACALLGFWVRITASLLPTKAVEQKGANASGCEGIPVPALQIFKTSFHYLIMSQDKIPLPEPLFSLIGGVERGAITNFYGPPGVGKTNICLLAALECLIKNGKVIFIDTEGGVSFERIRQITGNEEIFKKMILIEPKDFKEQEKIIKSLENESVDMIILDSAVALYRLECADPTKETLEANKKLSIQLSILSNLARKKNIPVLITAHTFKDWDSGENKIIGGDSIKYWSKSIVFLEHTGKTGERKASIVKHRSLPEGRSVKFMIVNEGIKPSGFKIF
jgi:DNA repair protein RadB